MLLPLALAILQTMFDKAQVQERTVFQTGAPYRPGLDIRADAAIVYGFGNNMPQRVQSWRDKGYVVHLMTGVAWGEYQDYLYGRFDGKNHEDEAQTRSDGQKISHGGDVYYMSPGPSYGKFLAQGVRKALDAGVEAVHLEEPEFWVAAGYSPGFKREWKDYYGEDWQAPDSSCEAQWRASKLKYMLYRRALQQVFDDVQSYNKEHGKHVRCYVATHSLLNYADWRIVSPESSLAKLNGCDGYIAQVWTGTARTPNYYEGKLAERTFDTAFLEYGAMMNVARATGKRLWFLADPVEDDPKHDWGDYKRNYEATLVASLLQPDVSRYEVMPWPERVFGGEYPSAEDPSKKTLIPPAYATELQTVIHSLENMQAQHDVKWECGTQGVGLVVSDSLMFERGGPTPSDSELSHVYGLALPFVKRGIPIQPVQLETATARDLSRYKVLLLSYRGMKPMTEDADKTIADWVRTGGVLVFVDDDGDPFNKIREWWNSGQFAYATPRQHLFASLGIEDKPGEQGCGRGRVLWLQSDPSNIAHDPNGAQQLLDAVSAIAKMAGVTWKETNGIVLQRGRYTLVATSGAGVSLRGDYVDLFDPELHLITDPAIGPGERKFLLDLPRVGLTTEVLASACKAIPLGEGKFNVEGIEGTNAVILFSCPEKPKEVLLDGAVLSDTTYDATRHLLWVQFANKAQPRILALK